MATEEGLGIEYDEDVICDVCRAVSNPLPKGEGFQKRFYTQGCKFSVDLLIS